MTEAADHLFTPKGDEAQWERVYARLIRMEIGDVITIADLLDITGSPSESSARGALKTATKHLRQSHRRTTEPVRGVGYRICHPAETLRLVGKENKKASRRVRESLDLSRTADHSMINVTDVQRLRALELHTAQIQESLSKISKQTAKHATSIETIEERQARQDRESAEMRERLDRLDAAIAARTEGDQ
jgi:hypothetical protein